MRIGVAATAPLGADVLERLAEQHEVAWLLTRPDAPQGRGRRLGPPPAKLVAEQLGLPVHQPARPELPGEADALCLVHEDDHAVDETPQVVVEVLDVVRYQAQRRVAVLADLPKREPATCFSLGFGLRVVFRLVAVVVLVVVVLAHGDAV